MTAEVIRTIVESGIKEGVKEVGEQVVKQGAKEFVKTVGKETAKKFGKNALKGATGGTLEEMLKFGFKELGLKEATHQALNQIGKHGVKVGEGLVLAGAPQEIGKQLFKESIVSGGGKAGAKYILPKALTVKAAAETGTKALSYGVKGSVIIEAVFVGAKTTWDIGQLACGNKTGVEVVTNVAINTVSAAGSVAGGVIGQAVIPIPWIGAIIGAAVGGALANEYMR